MAITPLSTPVAQRTDPPEIFVTRADTLVSELPIMVDEINVEIGNINSKAQAVSSALNTVQQAEAAVTSAANFKGLWTGLSGPLNTPASVYHIGQYWQLLNDLPDVTASVPSSSNNDWLASDEVASSTKMTAGIGLTGGGTLEEDRVFNVDLANASHLRSGTSRKVVDAATIYAANAPVVSSGSGSFTLDLRAGRVFQRTMTGSATLANPSSQVAGQSGIIYLIQDGSGGRGLTVGTDWKLVDGTPLIDEAPNAVNVFSYYVRQSGSITLTFAGSEQ